MLTDFFLKMYQKYKHTLDMINHFYVKNNIFTYIVINTSHF